MLHLPMLLLCLAMLPFNYSIDEEIQNGVHEGREVEPLFGFEGFSFFLI